MKPEVSICMCSHNRSRLLRNTLESIHAQPCENVEVIICEDGDDGGWTRGVCEEFGARYFQRWDRPDHPYSNPAIPWNIAIRQAQGDILILQNPECRHDSLDVIEKLAAPHREQNHLAVFATVMALNPAGAPWQWYCHPTHNARPFFFCGSIRREVVFRIRGFEEDFEFYGYDDNYFAICMAFSGITPVFRDDVPVQHQWHESTNCFGLQTNEALYNEKVRSLTNGDIEPACNIGREWGRITSKT